MTDIVDIRPDRFLRELRDGKSISEASEASGLSGVELFEYIETHPKFNIAIKECIIEYAEDQMRLNLANTITELILNTEQSIVQLREDICGEISAS